MIRTIHCDSLPELVTIETSTICNLKCPMCSLSIDTDCHRPAYLHADTIDRIKEVIKNANQLQLHGIGEPFLSDGFFECLKHISDAPGSWSIVNSNFLLVNEDIVSRLLASNLKEICMSVDSFNRDTYKKIRRGGNLTKLISNINLFISNRNRLQRSFPILTSNMTLMRSNIDQICHFIETSISLGISATKTWPMNDYGPNNARYKKDDFDYDFELPHGFKEHYNHRIDEAIEFANKRQYRFEFVKL